MRAGGCNRPKTTTMDKETFAILSDMKRMNGHQVTKPLLYAIFRMPKQDVRSKKHRRLSSDSQKGGFPVR